MNELIHAGYCIQNRFHPVQMERFTLKMSVHCYYAAAIQSYPAGFPREGAPGKKTVLMLSGS